MPRNLEEFNQKHSQQPCCILGSGPSISQIDLSLLPRFVTIAVNAGIIAYQHSNYFLSDDWDAANWSYFHKELKKSSCIVLLYEDKFKDKPNIFGNRTVYFRHRTGYHLTDKYEHANYGNHILQCRTSIGSAIHVAYIMGCNPIVLLGVDCRRLNNRRWFWELGGYPKPRRLDGRKADKYLAKRDSDTDLDSILVYWQRYAELIKERCKVYNASTISRVEAFEKKSLSECLKECHV